ncbi:GntR family transcriptional regulator [Kitasatospora sp. NPDC054939]
MSGTGAGGTRPVIQRNSLREQIAGALREEMMAGRLAAGRNFTVKEIAELYGVSATPAREALVDLAAQGLLRAEHHRGFTVPEFGWDDFLEIFETRVLITDAFFRQLTLRPELPDATRLPSLRRRADAAVRAARAGNLDVMVGCDRRFWQGVAGLTGNRRIADHLDWLRVQSWMYAAPLLRAMPLAGVCWTGHLDLVDAIEARDAATAKRILDEYNLFTAQLLAELSGEPLESVGVLPLLTEPPAPAAEPVTTAEPAAPGAEPPVPVPTEPPVPPAELPVPTVPTEPTAAGPVREGDGTERGAAAGEARADARRGGYPELRRSTTFGLGLGLVPQPRSVPFGRFAGRPADPVAEPGPGARPDPYGTPGR